MRNKREIFLIDDNDDTNFYNQDVVEESGLFDQILVFQSSTKALEHLVQRSQENKALPEIILLDIKMPDMDGFEFLDELEQLQDNIDDLPKVIMLTTSNHKKDHEQFEKSIIGKSYLVKPLELEVFKTVISEL